MTTNYYQKHNEKLQKKHVKDIILFSEWEKDKRWKKAPERYQRFAKEEKEKKE